ncbi:MAG TPA: TolC family protein [Terracidiphilus sp.]|nr:TolC family protein [Terracidiphilus sp.]
MKVTGLFHFSARPAPLLALCALAAACGGFAARAQTGSAPGNASSATNPYWGSVTAEPVTGETIKLSLDDAVKRGLTNNLGLREAEDNEKTLHGEQNQALQEFLPTITVSGDMKYAENDLVALGFSPGVVKEFSSLMPGGSSIKFSAITRDNLTEGVAHFDWTIFSGPVIAGWRAAGAAVRSSYFAKMSARGEVVQQVATIYLRSIADQSEVDNAKAQVAEAQLLYNQAHEEHLAGTVANLDELRARVELQTQQQSQIAAENQLAKDLIQLKREIGIEPGQTIELTDQAPYSELAEQTPEEVMAIAYQDRQDYQNLKNQAIEFKAVHLAYRAQRLPTLSFNSYYAETAVDGAGTRGNFIAYGTLKLPIFREAGLRGNVDASQAQSQAVQNQLADLHGHIDQQVRSALLDVASNKKLVDVARSNVDLATQALSDETDRVKAGVDDNLPLVEAQATLASAQSNLVESLYQYNVSKLALARSCGVLEQQYRIYLGEK